MQQTPNGIVFELETKSGGKGYRHVYVSKPLLIDWHTPSPAEAFDLPLSFTRSRILDVSGNKVQQHSLEYRRLARHQPSELCVMAEVLGWAQRNPVPTFAAQCEKRSFPCDNAGLTNFKTHMWSTCVRTIRIFAPFWVINRQPEPLVVSYCHRPPLYMAPCDWRLFGIPPQGQAFLALGIAQDCDAPHHLRKEGSRTAIAEEVAAAHSWRGGGPKLCPAFRADIVTRPTAVSVPKPNTCDNSFSRKTRKVHLFGVTVALAPPPFSRSKIITIYSRFVLNNSLPYDIWIKESTGSSPPFRLAAGSRCTFHPQSVGPRGEALICFTTTDPNIIRSVFCGKGARGWLENKATASSTDPERTGRSLVKATWSSQLTVARSASLQIRVKKPVESPAGSSTGTRTSTGRIFVGKEGRSLSWMHQNIHVAIQSLEESSFVVVFSEPTASEYILVNNTRHIIAFAQGGIRHKYIWELLNRGEQVEYAWTDPQRERKHLRFSFWDFNQQVIKSCDIARVRLHRPVTLPNTKEKIYFITDVCGSRRRVTVTTDLPYSIWDTPYKGRKPWKSLQHDLLKIRQRKAVKILRRGARAKRGGLAAQDEPYSGHHEETKTFYTTNTRVFTDRDMLRDRPSKDHNAFFTPRRSAKFSRPQASGMSSRPQEVPEMAALSDARSSYKTLAPQRMLRFCPAEQEFSKNVPWAESSSSSDQKGCKLFVHTDNENGALVDHAECGVFHFSEEAANAQLHEASRRHRMTTFLLSRNATHGTSGSSRSFRFRASSSWKNSLKRGNGQAHRLHLTSSSSETNQGPQLPKRSSFLDLGFYICLHIQGFGASLVDSTPQELAYIGCSDVLAEMRRLHAAAARDFRFAIKGFQIDNGVVGAQHQTIVRQTTLDECMEHCGRGTSMQSGDEAMAFGASKGVVQAIVEPLICWDAIGERAEGQRGHFFRFQLGGEWLPEATLVEYIDVELAPVALHVEADTAFVLLRFLIQLLQNRSFFLRSLHDRNIQLVREAATQGPGSSGYQQLRAFPETTVSVLATFRPLYIHVIALRPMLIILSARSQRLYKRHITTCDDDLVAVRYFAMLGDRMTDITNFPLKARLFVQQCLFTTAEQLVADLGSSYIQRCIRQLHKLVASIDVLGNPLRLITGVSSSWRVFSTQPFEGTLLTS